ncbi:hypothetical protein [Methylomonas sp. MgM2]
MKPCSMIRFTLLLIALLSAPVSAQEQRNDYSRSLMFEAPPTFEDPNYKTPSEQIDQFCEDLKKQIDELKNQPVRRSAARERYQKECIGN